MSSVDGLGVALGFIKSLQPKVQAQIARKIFALGDDPHPHDSAPLKGYEDLLRFDCGEYRIIYRFVEAQDRVEIILLGKHNDDEVYKELKRHMG